jgi:hypothetical protein
MSEVLVVSKLEAARRQMETAIAMFFNDGDVVSQHTLVMAAHGIVYDLARKRKIRGLIKDSPLVPAGARAAFIKALRLPQNFFKHADTDGGTKLRFRYNGTHFFLFDAVRLFGLLAPELTHPMKVFLVWFQLCYPDLLPYQKVEADLQQIRESTSNAAAFKLLGRVLLSQGDSGAKSATPP